MKHQVKVKSRKSKVESLESVLASAMQRFTELTVRQRSHALVLQVYRLSKDFPSDERQGLTAQLRRAALSVPTKIAEGSKRQSNQEDARFLNIVEASLVETENLLVLSRDLGYFARNSVEPILRELSEIARMLSSHRSKIEKESKVKS